jgi:hypothetical protein
VRIGSEQRVRVGDLGDRELALELYLVLLGPHRLREIFEIDLVADAGAGRNDAEIIERFLRPLEKLVALPISVGIPHRRFS